MQVTDDANRALPPGVPAAFNFIWSLYIHPQQGIYTAAIDDRIHFVTGIGDKGMSTGPGYARHSVARLL